MPPEAGYLEPTASGSSVSGVKMALKNSERSSARVARANWSDNTLLPCNESQQTELQAGNDDDKVKRLKGKFTQN